MSDYILVIKLLAYYLTGAFTIGIISLALMWWADGREQRFGEYIDRL